MRRQLIYAVLALILLATAGPLLALALGEATRVLGALFGNELFAGLVIALALFWGLGVIMWSLRDTKKRRPRPQRRGPSDFELTSTAANVNLEALETDLAQAPAARPPVHQPKEFTDRLAGYLHRDSEELAEPRPYAESKMSFWSRVGRLRWMGPKPAYLIRRLLERIREQVRGRAH